MSSSQEIITTVNNQLMEFRKQGFHIPGVATIVTKPLYMTPVIRIVEIDTNVDNKEIYKVGGGHYAFGLAAIMKFRIAGRIEFKESSGGSRVDDRRIPGLITARAVGKRWDLDGTTVELTDEKTIDLNARAEAMRFSYEKQANARRDLNDEQKSIWIEKQLKEFMATQRKFQHEIALSSAQSRVVIKLLGLRSSYTLQELKKPFVIVSVVPEVDMSDPDIKRLVTANMIGANNMYQPSPPQPPVAESQYIDINAAESAMIEADIHEVDDTADTPEMIEVDDFEDLPRKIQEERLRSLIGSDAAMESLSIENMPQSELTATYQRALRGEFRCAA